MRHATRVVWVLMVLSWASLAAAETLRGVVYYDADADGMRDAEEPGLANVRVTDGVRITRTGLDGAYALVSNPGYVVVRVSWPDGYWPTQQRFWHGTEVAGTDVDGLDFPLRKLGPQEIDRELLVVQITDVHATPAVVPQIQEVCGQINGLDPDFVVATGDLVMDVNGATSEQATRTLYAAYQQSTAGLAPPLLNVPGNHELCATGAKSFEGDQAMVGEGAYQRILGPLWYSFDRAGMRFLMLFGFRLGGDGGVGCGYQAGLPEPELHWLRAELAATRPSMPLVVFMHPPPGWLANKGALLELLANRPVVGIFAGHTHNVKSDHFGDAPVWESGAVSGSWWAGPERKDPCPDGSPPGYRLIRFGPEGVVDTEYRAQWAPQP